MVLRCPVRRDMTLIPSACVVLVASLCMDANECCRRSLLEPEPVMVMDGWVAGLPCNESDGRAERTDAVSNGGAEDTDCARDSCELARTVPRLKSEDIAEDTERLERTDGARTELSRWCAGASAGGKRVRMQW